MSPGIRGRLRRRGGGEDAEGETPAPAEQYFEIDPRELSGVWAAPKWLRDGGITAWLLVGFGLLGAAIISLLALTQTIVMPLIAAGVIAAVTSPLVDRMKRHGVPRALGAVIVLLGILALGVGVFLAVVGGITGENGSITSQLADAKDTLAGWLQDVGVDPSTAANAKDEASSSVSAIASQLLDGIGSGLSALSGLVFFLALTILSLSFFLGDGPNIRAWVEGHMGVPDDVGHIIGERTLGALRGYFLGVTIVGAFNAIVVSLGAWILGVPLVGTIAVVTLIGGYIPYLGAWTAATFSVLVALGGAGPEAAGGMVAIQLLANSVLQQLVQPFAMGAALGIHPLAVLIVTIAGGALFGTVGLILAAPMTSAIVRISDDLSHASGSDDEEGNETPVPEEENDGDDP